MERIFLGNPWHWLLLVGLAAVLGAMGTYHLHVRAFAWFSAALVVLTAAVLGLIVARYRPGDDITREPIEGAELPTEAEGEAE